jgi:Fur family transcriptional regulator, ferric uptake regulator
MTIPYNAASLKAALHEKGYRMTPQREVILDLFCQLPRGEHLSAEEVAQRLSAGGDRSSLSTVYRTLKLMSQMGILRELDLAEDHKHYELNETVKNSHHHLLPSQCRIRYRF